MRRPMLKLLGLLPILFVLLLIWAGQTHPRYRLVELSSAGVTDARADSSPQKGKRAPALVSSLRTFRFHRYTNVAGQAAWSAYRNQGSRLRLHAFLSSRGRTLDLGTLGGKNCLVRGVSASGQVIGMSNTRLGEQHAFLWQAGKMLDLGTLPRGAQSDAQAINAAGQVVGNAQTAAGDFHAFFWEKGVLLDLGVLPRGDESWARALNERGQVVGCAMTENASLHAVVWQRGKISDLNRLAVLPAGLVLEIATRIDEQGRIEVEGSLDGHRHTYMLIPK